MPLQNRVTPLGDVIATEERGLVYGNRGCLHDDTGAIRRRYATRRWIACRLQFRGRRRTPLMAPGRFTELFFLDEATAFAAGHRPCAECRRDSYNTYRAAWAQGLGVDLPSAKQINRQLHGERIVRGTHRRRIHPIPWADLPDGTFVLLDDAPAVVSGTHVIEWTHEGYRSRHRRPRRATANVITPPSTLAALRAGYPVQVDNAVR
jgi:hypothetical protein